MWSKPCIVVVLMAGLAVAMAAGAESVGDRLQKGIYQEETVGDLDAAMKIYQEIVADEEANRPHAARCSRSFSTRRSSAHRRVACQSAASWRIRRTSDAGSCMEFES